MKKLLAITSGLGLVIGLAACEQWGGQDREVGEPTVTDTPTAPEGQIEEGELGEPQPGAGQVGQGEGQPGEAQPGQQRPGTEGEVAYQDPKEQGFWTDEGDPIENPEEYVGRRFVALAKVDEVVGPNYIVLNEPDWEMGDVSAFFTGGAKNTTVNRDDVVRIKGTVQRFAVAEVESQLGWDLEREVETELENKPIVVIDSIEVVEEQE